MAREFKNKIVSEYDDIRRLPCNPKLASLPLDITTLYADVEALRSYCKELKEINEQYLQQIEILKVRIKELENQECFKQMKE